MTNISDKYETVIGLEIHAQLQTQTKLFCGDSIAFGAAPNTHVSPITLGHPGTLPKTNKVAVAYAIKMGLACNCTIERANYFARKNYFYPDLPKGYQISQHTTPICVGGYVTINTSSGQKNIELNRIHIEEDAGKSMHDLDEQFTCIDLNRAGTPLIEIVTEPCIHSSDEAFEYVSEVRRLVQWIGVCDGNMEEGSLRCDANVSVRLKGATQLGTRVEVKNLNSIKHLRHAVELEIDRLIELTEKGIDIIQETRSYNADKGITFAIRTKEDAEDYRYFPEPDLAPFEFDDSFVEGLQKTIPELPSLRSIRYKNEYGLSDYDALQLTEEKELSDLYDTLVEATTHKKLLANFLIGPVRSHLSEYDLNN